MRRLATLLMATLLAQPANAHHQIPLYDLAVKDRDAIMRQVRESVPDGIVESVQGYGSDAEALWAEVWFAPHAHTAKFDLVRFVTCNRSATSFACAPPETLVSIAKPDGRHTVSMKGEVSPGEAYEVFEACWLQASYAATVVSRDGSQYRWFGIHLGYGIASEGSATLGPSSSCQPD